MASGASSPKGWGINKEAMREFDRVADKNGYSRLRKALNDVDDKVREVAEAILEIPLTDRIGDGIHAAAALARNAPALSRPKRRCSHECCHRT
jgi:hypothetical protein